MRFENEIRGLAEVARDLQEERSRLAAATPFGSALEETRHDLGRVASPVLAVVGPAKTGKSTLINRLCGIDLLPVGPVPTTSLPVCLRAGEAGCLVQTSDGPRDVGLDPEAIREHIRAPEEGADYLVWQLPELGSVPWDWLDTPGWDALDRDGGLDLDPWDLADLWVLTTSATHPMAAGDKTLLAQLATLARGSQVCVVITRCDQVDAAAEREILAWVKARVADVWPADPPPVLTVSSRSGVGTRELRDHLGKAVAELVSERVRYELHAWIRLLEELGEIGRMKVLGSVGLRTVEAARERLHRQLLGAVADLKGRLPLIAEEILRSLDGELPAPSRTIAPAYAKLLEARIAGEIDAIGTGLQDGLAAVLGSDLPQKTSVNLALKRLTTLLDKRPPDGFEPRGAAMGASLGLSAGLSAALFATIPLIGLPFAVASIAAGLAGGALGALFGGKGIVVDAEQLRDRVATPLNREVVSELDRVTAAARLEIDRLCNVMERAATLQASAGSSGKGTEALRAAVASATARAEALSGRADELSRRLRC